IFAGNGVVFEISRVTKLSHSCSNGVTLTIMPQRAYVDLPTQIVNTSREILEYSADRARAKVFGGISAQSDRTVTKERSSKPFGSTVAQFTLVKILNSAATRRS